MRSEDLGIGVRIWYEGNRLDGEVVGLGVVGMGMEMEMGMGWDNFRIFF